MLFPAPPPPPGSAVSTQQLLSHSLLTANIQKRKKKEEVKAALFIYWPSFRFASLADVSGVLKVTGQSSVSPVM